MVISFFTMEICVAFHLVNAYEWDASTLDGEGYGSKGRCDVNTPIFHCSVEDANLMVEVGLID